MATASITGLNGHPKNNDVSATNSLDETTNF